MPSATQQGIGAAKFGGYPTKQAMRRRAKEARIIAKERQRKD